MVRAANELGSKTRRAWRGGCRLVSRRYTVFMSSHLVGLVWIWGFCCCCCPILSLRLLMLFPTFTAFSITILRLFSRSVNFVQINGENVCLNQSQLGVRAQTWVTANLQRNRYSNTKEEAIPPTICFPCVCVRVYFWIIDGIAYAYKMYGNSKDWH